MRTLIPKRMSNKKSIVIGNLSIKDIVIDGTFLLIIFITITMTLLNLFFKVTITIGCISLAAFLTLPKGTWAKPHKTLMYKWKWLSVPKNFKYKK